MTYAHPYHLFVDAERQILELFARLLSTALEKAYIAEETLAASCRLREQSRLDLQQLLQALQRLMEPLAGIGRSVELLLSTTPPAFLEEPRPPRSPLAHSSYEEVLACLDVSLQRSLGVLGELARRQEATPGGRAGLADVIRQQVNEILSRFDSLRVLVITPDGELFAMLAWALSIAGYTPVRIDSCQQVTACVREGMDQGHTPALLILDPAALLDVSLVDFHTALQTGCDIALPLLLLETGDPRTQGWPNRYALQAPFTVHSLLGAVQACAHGFGDPST